MFRYHDVFIYSFDQKLQNFKATQYLLCDSLIPLIFLSVVQGGQGLHATLNSHSKKFVGILNGIDTDAWNPATDTFLKVQYSANDMEGKAENKEALRSHLKLSSADVQRPLVIFITSLMVDIGEQFLS